MTLFRFFPSVVPESPVKQNNQSSKRFDQSRDKFFDQSNLDKPSFYKPDKFTLPSHNGPNGTFRKEINLRSVEELRKFYILMFCFSSRNIIWLHILFSIYFFFITSCKFYLCKLSIALKYTFLEVKTLAALYQVSVYLYKYS